MTSASLNEPLLMIAWRGFAISSTPSRNGEASEAATVPRAQLAVAREPGSIARSSAGATQTVCGNSRTDGVVFTAHPVHASRRAFHYSGVGDLFVTTSAWNSRGVKVHSDGSRPQPGSRNPQPVTTLCNVHRSCLAREISSHRFVAGL